MAGAMLLAHLVGDFILQWDRLASWKSRALSGVLTHGLIVWGVTWLFSLPFDPGWWWGPALIGGLHLLIDAVQLLARPPISPLARFGLDQLAHLLVIAVVLMAGGFLNLAHLMADVVLLANSERLLLFLIGYAFITMPAWVIAKFVAFGLVQGSGPDFALGGNKYAVILERLLITTFVLLGQLLLVPLVALPRMLLERSRLADNDQTAVYLVETLCGIVLAVTVGLALSQL